MKLYIAIFILGTLPVLLGWAFESWTQEIIEAVTQYKGSGPHCPGMDPTHLGWCE